MVVEKVYKEQSIKQHQIETEHALQAQLLQQGFGQAQKLQQKHLLNNFRSTTTIISTTTKL